jgi:hypothetical protein
MSAEKSGALRHGCPRNQQHQQLMLWRIACFRLNMLIVAEPAIGLLRITDMVKSASRAATRDQLSV